MKKLLALLLALLMIVSLGCASFSAQEDIYESENPAEDIFLSKDDMLDDEEIQATLDEFVVGITGEKLYVGFLAGRQIVQTANTATHIQNGFTKVGTDKAGTAGYQEQCPFGE